MKTDQQIIDDLAIEASHLVRASWTGWLKYSGHCEKSCPEESYREWLLRCPTKTGAGTTADQVQNFHAGFLCANSEH